MAAMAGLVHHTMAGQAMTAGQAPAGKAPAGQAIRGASASPAAVTGNASSSAGSSSSSSGTISANDFLSLLVTEMQNQDPTADSDPNEYINQLVQVNSLEQLIDINQNLTTALGGTGTTPDSQKSKAAAHPAGTAGHAGGTGVAAAISQFAGSPFAKSQGGGPPMVQASHAGHAPGNLSVPEDHASAHKVAHALSGGSHAPTPAGKARGQ